MGNTVVTLARCVNEIPKNLVHRQLDSRQCTYNSTSLDKLVPRIYYREVCEKGNVLLAEDCPHHDKAFSNSTYGKVLGIEFKTENLSWKLPEDKRVEYTNLIHDALATGELGLEASQNYQAS